MAYLQIHGNVGIYRAGFLPQILVNGAPEKRCNQITTFQHPPPQCYHLLSPNVSKKLCHQVDSPCAGSRSYLNSGLSELGSLSELLSCVDVWVVGPFKGLLQLLQLLSGEGGSAAALLTLQRQVWFGFNIRAFIQPVTWVGKKYEIMFAWVKSNREKGC